MDVNLANESSKDIKGRPELGPPGAGGWPTIRYFTPETGLQGAAYQKVTDLPMCQELGDRMRMMDYVEGYGHTQLCNVQTQVNCTPKEIEYLTKYQDKPPEEWTLQLTRLEEMISKPMNPELMEWAWRRMRILMNLQKTGAASAGVQTEL